MDPQPASNNAPVLYIAGDVHLDGGANAFPLFLDHLATRTPARPGLPSGRSLPPGAGRRSSDGPNGGRAVGRR